MIQIAFSTCTHWRKETRLLDALAQAFPAATVRIEANPCPLSVPQFASYIANLEGGYHADRMPVVLLVPASFIEFAKFLEELSRTDEFLVSTVNIFDPSKANQYFKVMNLKSLIPILRTASEMCAPTCTPDELMDLQSRSQR